MKYIKNILEHNKLIEDSQQSPFKKFQIMFENDKFYVSDNTIKVFVKILYTQDQSMIYDSSKNGSGKNHRIIYIKSSNLTIDTIKNIIRKFENNYNYLKINVVSTKY